MTKPIDPLRQAAQEQAKPADIGWMASAAMQAVDFLSTAVFLVSADGGVIERNPAADRIVAAEDGLVISADRLATLRSSDRYRWHDLATSSAYSM